MNSLACSLFTFCLEYFGGKSGCKLQHIIRNIWADFRANFSSRRGAGGAWSVIFWVCLHSFYYNWDVLSITVNKPGNFTYLEEFLQSVRDCSIRFISIYWEKCIEIPILFFAYLGFYNFCIVHADIEWRLQKHFDLASIILAFRLYFSWI